MKTMFLSTLFCLFAFTQLYATHNYAGEISYRQLTNQIIECTVTTYTKSSSVDADRDSLTLSWGDGQSQRVVRANGPDTNGDGVPDGEELYNGYKVNQYIAVHTYQTLGSYTLSMEDPNRNAGILNVNFPNSISIPFYIETGIELSTDFNSSPILLNPPIDFAMMGQVFLHTPNAFDIDDDSIAYKMVTPLQDINDPVPNYTPISGLFSLNEETGLITWLAPNQTGEYVIAIEVTSYRNGQLVDRMIRDMSIIVLDGFDLIPGLNAITTYSTSEPNTVMLGETVNIEFTSEELNVTQFVTLRSNSGLYEFFDSPATFTITEENGNNSTAVFNWTPTAEHIRDYPIQLVIKSSDDLGLVSYLIFRFEVVDVTSNENLVSSPNIKIYPNPVASILHLDTAESLSGHYQIYDLKGQSLQSGKLENTRELSVETLPAGQYYLQVKDRLIIPFVKQ